MTQMKTKIGIALVLALGVAGCGRLADSRLNPLNLFRSSEEVTVAPTIVEGAELADSRGLIDQILTLDVAQTTGGAIIRATGVAARQGNWDGDLVPVPTETPGRLTLAFVAQEAPGPTPVSTQRSREVTVAIRLTERELAGIRDITVTGARNARAVRR
ncbi:hypothetical protein [Palleronia sp. THAF1]|uniref:hypothetical protein n=1 Tax=Palleronia sp. THAF1 TaxID=2587842 RepID=UPI000F51C3A8|nr:hypothetical protein [Palleronia sp. THAF1]